jgi:glutamine synthetase
MYEDECWKPVVAPEVEFYLIQKNIDPDYELAPPIGRSGRREAGRQSYSIDAVNEFEPIVEEMYDFCEAQELDVDTLIHESGLAQMEINFLHGDALDLADQVFVFKRTMRETALRHDIYATFMAKPFAETAGSGLHLHVSMLDSDGKNIFAGSSKDGAFSDQLRHAIGGMGALMAESMAIFAPNANSYRRHAPGNYVPASPTWGLNHRGVAMRIPLSAPANTRIEHRVAGADANPYLVVAAVMAGIHHGISNRCEPLPMTAEGEEIEYQVTVPVRWPQALDAFDAAGILPAYLGEGYCSMFSLCRREEEANYNAEIPTKDFEWYLRAV